MMTVNGQRIIFKAIDSGLLTKTLFSEKGIENLAKSIASQFLGPKKNHFIETKTGNVIHFSALKNNFGDVIVSLENITEDGAFYQNTGIKSERITKNLQNTKLH
ncbi:hypothetical protein C1N61_29825 (plasmid) [Priestia aryabhattai]